MARVKTFYVGKTVPDASIAEFITECEKEFYVNVSSTFLPLPTPRITVIVTKLDEKESNGDQAV